MTVTAEQAHVGFGRRMRKEDARFLRGKGNYVDDFELRGMLHGAVLRSPYAHARLVSIDTSAAEAHPKVRAVITGALLETLKLAWIPSLSHDVVAVLATDKVRFHGQEVAFVVADDRYAARDALELIEVEYEPLPPVIDARRALDPDAAIIRDDIEGKADNHIFDWDAGDKAATDAAFADAEVVVEEDILYPRVHPAPLETCGAIADMDPVTGKLTIYCNTQAPHAHRTLYAIVAGLPEHKIRIVSPDIGGGFGNKVGIYPGYVLAVVGSILTGRPVKWVEDRSENLMSTSFARDYHMHTEIASTREGKILAMRVECPRGSWRIQQHCAADEVSRRLLPHLHWQLRLSLRVLHREGRLHQQGPRGRGVRLFVPDHRGGVRRRAHSRLPGFRVGHGSCRITHEEPAACRAVPVPIAYRLGVRLGRLPAHPADGDGDRRL